MVSVTQVKTFQVRDQLNWLSVYITVRVPTHSIILFWRREPKLLRTACQTLKDSAWLLHTKVGPCLFYPIFVPLSRMCFPLVCLEDSFSFPQILPAVTTFLFLFFFSLPQVDRFFPYAISSIWCISLMLFLLVCSRHLFIHLLHPEVRDQFSNALISPKLNTALSM